MGRSPLRSNYNRRAEYDPPCKGGHSTKCPTSRDDHHDFMSCCKPEAFMLSLERKQTQSEIFRFPFPCQESDHLRPLVGVRSIDAMSPTQLSTPAARQEVGTNTNNTTPSWGSALSSTRVYTITCKRQTTSPSESSFKAA